MDDSKDGELDYAVGIDWGSAEHQACVVDARGKQIGERAFAHSGEGLTALCDWIAKLTAGSSGSRVAVVIEVMRGPVIAMVVERGYRVFSCNPKQLDRLRDRVTMAGAKDDRLDALVLAEAGRKDRELLREVPQDAPELLQLRELVRLHRDLVDDRLRLQSRLRDQLWRYYPQMLKLGNDVAEPWRLALWMLAPTPEAAKRLKRAAVAKVLREHRIRRLTADEVLATLCEKKLEVAPGAAEAAALHIQVLLPQLRVLNDQLRDVDKRIDGAVDAFGATLPDEDGEVGQKSEQRDIAILKELPGAGRIVIATLLAEAWLALRDRDYQQLRGLCGVAPVTRRTGKQGKPGGPRANVSMRQACNAHLREALWHWAGGAILSDAHWKQAAAALRARGKSAGHARRVIGNRLLRVTCACLRDGVAYDATRWTRESHPANAA